MSIIHTTETLPLQAQRGKKKKHLAFLMIMSSWVVYATVSNQTWQVKFQREMCLCAHPVLLLPKNIVEKEWKQFLSDYVRAWREKSVDWLEQHVKFTGGKKSRQAQLSLDLCARRSLGECQGAFVRSFACQCLHTVIHLFNLKRPRQKVKRRISLS